MLSRQRKRVKGKRSRRGRAHLRVRNRVSGTAARPRLAVFRSLQHVYVQAIDDTAGATVVQASSLEKELRSGLSSGGNREAARSVGEKVAERAIAKGIKRVVFDRGGFIYHGRIRALAEGARDKGLEF